MKYIIINYKTIMKIKEFKNISTYFWEVEDIREFYQKKECINTLYKIIL